MTCSPNNETDFFDILAGDTLAPYLFVIWYCTSNVNRSTKRKWFHTKTAWSRRYPAETMTDADYADDQALLSNNVA